MQVGGIWWLQIVASDVNKDLTFKDKDLTFKATAKAKDLTVFTFEYFIDTSNHLM